jgi:hypothetical protein
MTDYFKIARTALSGPPQWAGAGAESTTPVDSSEIEVRPEPAEVPPTPTPTLEEREHANTILGRVGVRLMALEGGVTIGIWSDLDSAELRAALRVFQPDGVPPVRYLDSDVPMKYKLRRVLGEPVPLDVLHAMEENPWTPWETRDRMLSEMGWSPNGIPWAEWKAASLNRLFLVQGVTGKRGRITAATVRHGERAAHLTEEGPDGE